MITCGEIFDAGMHMVVLIWHLAEDRVVASNTFSYLFIRNQYFTVTR